MTETRPLPSAVVILQMAQQDRLRAPEDYLNALKIIDKAVPKIIEAHGNNEAGQLAAKEAALKVCGPAWHLLFNLLHVSEIRRDLE